MGGIYFDHEYTSPRPLGQKSNVLLGRAAVELLFGRIVAYSEGGFILASPEIGSWIGVHVGKRTAAGKQAEILSAGVVESYDWTTATGSQFLIPDRAYFLQPWGMYGTMIAIEGSVIRVGRALSKTALNFTFDLKVL